MILPEQERIETFLAGLGNTYSEVAKSLEDRGFSGVRRDPCACPISDALTKTFPVSEHEWSTTAYFVGIGPLDSWVQTHEWKDAEVMNVDLPYAARTFIQLFDKGFYPGLERVAP